MIRDFSWWRHLILQDVGLDIHGNRCACCGHVVTRNSKDTWIIFYIYLSNKILDGVVCSRGRCFDSVEGKDGKLSDQWHVSLPAWSAELDWAGLKASPQLYVFSTPLFIRKRKNSRNMGDPKCQPNFAIIGLAPLMGDQYLFKNPPNDPDLKSNYSHLPEQYFSNVKVHINPQDTCCLQMLFGKTVLGCDAPLCVMWCWLFGHTILRSNVLGQVQQNMILGPNPDLCELGKLSFIGTGSVLFLMNGL